MNKELKALKQLFDYSKSIASLSKSQSYENRKIIEQALERKEKLEKFVKLLNNFNMREALGLNMTSEDFNDNWLLDFTQEDYDLLKEILK